MSIGPASAVDGDDAVLAMFRAYRESGDRTMRNRLIEDHRGIAIGCAKRFRDKGEPTEDLVQVAMLGLVKAVERYDPESSTPFAGFAVPTITGEIRRHFRDTTWSVHVPRRMKEVTGLLGPCTERLCKQLGRQPTMNEVAADLRISVEDVIAAMEASAAYRPARLEASSGSDRAVGEPGKHDRQFDEVDARVVTERLLDTLPERERTILRLRFLEEKSQSEIAGVVGTSQVHVSRLIRASLNTLRDHAEDIDPQDAAIAASERDNST